MNIFGIDRFLLKQPEFVDIVNKFLLTYLCKKPVWGGWFVSLKSLSEDKQKFVYILQLLKSKLLTRSVNVYCQKF